MMNRLRTALQLEECPTVRIRHAFRPKRERQLILQGKSDLFKELICNENPTLMTNA